MAGAPKPLPNHLQHTPLTKPNTPNLVWVHLDVWGQRKLVFYALPEKKIAAGAVKGQGGRWGAFLVQLRANRLILN